MSPLDGTCITASRILSDLMKHMDHCVNIDGEDKIHSDIHSATRLTITFQLLPLKLALAAAAAALKVSLPPGTVSTHMSPMVT